VIELVDAVDLQASLVQTLAAEKVVQTESHHGETTQQVFLAELSKQDEQRVRDVQRSVRGEEEQRIDSREEGRRGAKKRRQSLAGEEGDSLPEDESPTRGDEGEHIIDITV